VTGTALLVHRQRPHVVAAAAEYFQQMTVTCQASAVDGWLHTPAMTAEWEDEAV